MNVQFGVTRICLFDLHLSAAALRTPGLLQPSLRFLADPAEYELRHDQTWEVETTHFRLRPLGARSRWNHFWNGLRTLCKVEGTSEQFPRFHIPLDSRVNDCALTANLPAPFGSVPVHARVLVWPYGWSTHLEVSLVSPVGLPALVDASQSLRQDVVFDARSGSGASILTNASLSAVFRHVTTWLREDLFTAAVPDQRPVSRHAVISLSGFVSTGDPFTYSLDIDPEHPQLPTADRARLHAILLGRPITLPELLERERQGTFLITPLSTTGFALTYFEHGCLLVLLKAAPRHGKREAAARCLWRNTASLLTTTSALCAAEREFRTQARDWIDASANWALLILQRLPSYYDSLLCQRVFARDAGLRKVRLRDDDE